MLKPIDVFHEPGYLEHNAARLEHLASLGLPIEGRTVLMLGSGIGDHVQFFLDRGCRVTVTDGRKENVEQIQQSHDWDEVYRMDVELINNDDIAYFGGHDIIMCYGLLYHTSDPIQVLRNIAALKPKLLLLETCVWNGMERTKHEPVLEDARDPRCSLKGVGCRPSREMIRAELIELFDHVYVSTTQPAHQEFPLNWTRPHDGEARAVFIASTEKLENPLLTDGFPMIQTVCEPT